MRFLIDAQLPPVLARWIGSQGHIADHIAVVLGERAKDAAIVKYGAQNGSVIVTKDADFLTLAPPPPLLLVTTGNVANRILLSRFQDRFGQAVADLEQGQGVVEVG